MLGIRRTLSLPLWKDRLPWPRSGRCGQSVRTRGLACVGPPEARRGASAGYLPFLSHRLSVYRRREVHLDPGGLGGVTNWTCFAWDVLVSPWKPRMPVNLSIPGKASARYPQDDAGCARQCPSRTCCGLCRRSRVWYIPASQHYHDHSLL